MNIEGLTLAPLLWELNAKLTGGRIDKIFQPDDYTLVIWVRQPHETLRLIISVNPASPCLYLSDTPPENPAIPSAFCMLLRKHLVDGRIAAVTQHGLDRIAYITIDVRDESRRYRQ
ncbi:RNA-binding protein [Thermosinus carboxydivorans Nor1]|uniref:RNA-binding protein n=1 Tax=Thermosinus carboxydivorans Nor1 TaxID=401526 RepID=A1HMY9_9FIRM|nr:NFACT family protein [Thermosinus carboxydivorans]EAX48620.1 RNA-binding protein [Thermosinus carboxydivorans Nor1]